MSGRRLAHNATAEDIQIAYTFTNPNEEKYYLFIWSNSLFRFVVPMGSLKSNRKSNVWLFQSNKSWIETGFRFIAGARAHTHDTRSAATHSSIKNIIWFFLLILSIDAEKPLPFNDWKKRAKHNNTRKCSSNIQLIPIDCVQSKWDKRCSADHSLATQRCHDSLITISSVDCSPFRRLISMDWWNFTRISDAIVINMN